MLESSGLNTDSFGESSRLFYEKILNIATQSKWSNILSHSGRGDTCFNSLLVISYDYKYYRLFSILRKTTTILVHSLVEEFF